MLILEIIMTVLAWRKGWRWYSLIPCATAFSIGLVYGFIGINPPGAVGVYIEILALLALFFMMLNPKKLEKK
jgi:hypothetical protein